MSSPVAGENDLPIGLGREADGFDFALELGGDGDAVGRFVLDQQEAAPGRWGVVRRKLVCELGEAFNDGVQAVVDVEVVGFDVEDDGGGGGELVEASIVLAGFGDEGGSVAGAVAAAELWAVGADDDGGVQSGGDERVAEHGGGGGLAVGSGDGDADGAGLGHHAPEHGGVLDDFEFSSAGLEDFGVVVRHGGGDDQGLRVEGHGLGGLLEVDGEAFASELLDQVGVGAFAAGDGGAASGAKAGEAGHAAAADADEVETLVLHGVVTL